ncbi:MAG: hypothetical protein ACREVN_04150 [Gammaproteobacteria bacterium]
MPDNKTYKLREQARNDQPPGDDSSEDTVVLEPGWKAVASNAEREPPLPPPGGLRRVHASLYTLQAYKRWMMQIRETWKSDRR